MKNAIVRQLLAVGAVFVFLAFSPRCAYALEFNLVDGEPIHSQDQIDSLKTGDTLIMTCARCKNGTMVTYDSDPSSPNHVQWLKPGAEKKCASCGGTMKAVKKGDKVELICSKCGPVGFIDAYHTGK